MTTAYAGAIEVQITATQRITKAYYSAGGQLVALRVYTAPTNSVLYYLHSDHLGSTSLTTCGNSACGPLGSVVGELKYYPFGQTRSTWGSTPTDRRFTGQVSEEAHLGSLYFYNARYYSPAIGRFLSADTIVPQLENPQAWNRYAYVVNSPLKYTDPSGHCFIILCIVAIGAAVVSVAAATEAIAYTAEVVQTGSGWDATEYWNRVTHPRLETVANAAVVVASTVAEPLDYLSTGVQCLTGECSVADVALTVVPGALGAIRKSLDQAVDAAQALENASDAARALENAGDAVPHSGLTGGNIPDRIYRAGDPSPSNLRPRPGENGVSFRDSLSNPWPMPDTGPVFKPGKPYFGIDTSKLPDGSVIPDPPPPGHVIVRRGVDLVSLRDEPGFIVERGKFPK